MGRRNARQKISLGMSRVDGLASVLFQFGQIHRLRMLAMISTFRVAT